MKYTKLIAILFLALFFIQEVALLTHSKKVSSKRRMSSKLRRTSRLFEITNETFQTFMGSFLNKLLNHFRNRYTDITQDAIIQGVKNMIANCGTDAWKAYDQRINKKNQDFSDALNIVYSKQNKIDTQMQKIEKVCLAKDNEAIKILTNEIKDDIKGEAERTTDPVLKKKFENFHYSMSDGYIYSGAKVCTMIFEDQGSYFAPIYAALDAVKAYVKCGRNEVGLAVLLEFLRKALLVVIKRLTTSGIYSSYRLAYGLIAAAYSKEINATKLGELFANYAINLIDSTATVRRRKRFLRRRVY